MSILLKSLNAPTPTVTPFRASMPLEITALDDSHQSLLFITGGAGKDLTITINNVSQQDYEIPALTGQLSATNYQLAIRFRPGTLSAPTSINIKPTDIKWALTHVRENDGVDTLYFDSGEILQLGMGKPISFTLRQVLADGMMGARTTRVEFSYLNLLPTSGSNLPPLSGTLSQTMRIINAEGVDASPFYFGVLGTPTVINDGQTLNDITLILGVSGQLDLSLSSDTEARTQIVVSIEGDDPGNGVKKPWTLASTANLSNLEVKTVASSQIEDDTLETKHEPATWTESKVKGDIAAWSFEASVGGYLTLDSPLVIQLSGLITDYPIGLATIRLSYYNVPGYWDGTQSTRVIKSSIGNDVPPSLKTPPPLEKMQMQADVAIGGYYLQGTNNVHVPYGSLSVNKIQPNGGVNGVEIGDFANDDNTQWAKVTWLRDFSAGGTWDEGLIKVGKEQKAWGGTEPSAHFGRGGFGIHTNESREVGFYTTGFKPMLICEGGTGNTYVAGKLGVGSAPNKPDASSPELEVIGDAQITGRYQDKTGDVMPVGAIIAYGGSTPPPGWLICNGEPVPTSFTELIQVLAGSGATKAKTPDLRSRFVVGAGQGAGLSPYDLNAEGGEETHKLTIPEMPLHAHAISYPLDWSGTGDSSVDKIFTPNKDIVSNPQKWTNGRGGDQPHNNLPPYYALTYIIKC